MSALTRMHVIRTLTVSISMIGFPMVANANLIIKETD